MDATGIHICPLASGSKGNCIYIGTPSTKLLIDAGISTRAIRKKLSEIHVAIEDIDAVVISHDHSDHIQGLKILGLKMGVPIFANHETAKGIMNYLHACPKFKIFSTGETFAFRDMEIHPFTVQHDTLDPVAFTMQIDRRKLGFCTDLGFVTSLVRTQLKACDYLYIEANHEPSMVHACPRPVIYKQRVLSRFGHLSNSDCGNLLREVAHDGLKHVHLAHLSKECNSHETAFHVISDILEKNGIQLQMSIAAQDKISEAVYF